MELINKTINNYKITKLLGQGAFGQVYIGEKNNVRYVLKFIKISQGLNKNNEYRNNVLSIITEIYALKKISENNTQCGSHTNNSSLCLIETFINFDSTPSSFCIVTNYLDNAVELSKVMYKREDYVLKIDDFIFVMSKLISQLSKLHTYNIVHCDIKPENVIVQTNNKHLGEIDNVLFIDYGVSCLENCLPSGTIPYAAPELLPIIGNIDKKRLTTLKDELNTGKISSKNKIYKTYNDKYKIPFSKDDYKKTDVYSLGVTFYKLLNNKFPYPFKNDYKKESNILRKLDKSDDSNNSSNSSNYEVTATEYYDYPDDVVNGFQTQIPLLQYYQSHDTLIPSSFNLSSNSDINTFLNKIIDSMLILNPSKRPTIFQIKKTFDSFKKDIYGNNLNSSDNLLGVNTENLFNLSTFKEKSPDKSSFLNLDKLFLIKKRNSSVDISNNLN